jgi:hypothetical protein
MVETRQLSRAKRLWASAGTHLFYSGTTDPLVRSIVGELSVVDNVDTARRANSADNSAASAPLRSACLKQQRW